MSDQGLCSRKLSGGAESNTNIVDENSIHASGDGGAPVLSHTHVSCYVTAANRAASVLEVIPQRNCVRVISKFSDENLTSILSACGSEGVRTGDETSNVSAEWEFHSVFSSSSPSHAADFFKEITLPALQTARDGINTNIVAWGVHPTQKFRLLFGKSGGSAGITPQAGMAVSDVVELYGQLAGMLHAFFTQPDMTSVVGPWRLGISSWILVNNQAFDLLKTPTGILPIDSRQAVSVSLPSNSPPSFVSLEATSLDSAFRIVQNAKTNRIVRKHTAESAHFFVRLALFHCGQVSTVHLIDLIDQKDFLDRISMQEKLEIYNILHGLRQPLMSSKQSNGSGAVPGSGGSETTEKMVLSSFMLPILTANAKTFFYANVIDSRASLRESVQMLNAVANLRDFTCVCQRLRGVSFKDLGFQVCSNNSVSPVFSDQCKMDQQVNRQETEEVERRSSSPPLSEFPHTKPMLSDIAVKSDAMRWLSTFAQRKRDILGGSIDTIKAVAPTPHDITVNAAVQASSDGHVDNEAPQQSGIVAGPRPSIVDLYDRLRDSMADVSDLVPTTMVSPRASYRTTRSFSPSRSASVSYQPLPIVDEDDDRDSYAQVKHNNNAVAVGARLLPHASPEKVSTRTQPNNGRPHDHLSPKHRNSGNSYVPASRPVVDSAELEETTSPQVPLASPMSPPYPLLSSTMTGNHTLKVFNKTGLPTSMLSPPNVEGLDEKTAQKVQAADATLLRKNYEALLSIVREQQQAKELAETRAAEAIHDQEEQRAMFEVQIENMKLANVGLRSKVRALENRTSLPQLFEQYEQELRTLHAQIQELQERNVALELQASGVGINASFIDFKKKYQQVVDEKLALEKEVIECRKRERHLQVQGRIAGESTRRVDQLSRDLNNKEEDLVAARLSKQRLSAEMNQILEKADQLHHENEKLLQEKAATAEELLATRMYLASLDNEKKKAAILDRFVEKHGDRMSKLRQRDTPCAGSKGENWRRDQHARECEDKLLATVKRSLPQAVPLCNKILRRLEMQELSLREFSEREVDFINMLVELVSDQPTVSLKQMIEQEMNKLQS